MTIAHDTMAQQIYDPETGAWDGQLPHADLVDQLSPPIERKPGGPLDRSKWVISHAPALGHAAFKLLVVLNDYANASGICWPSRAALMGLSGMSGSAVDRAIRELKRSGAVDVIEDGKGRKSNTWQLSGGLNDWAETHHKWGIKLTISGELNSPKVGNGTPSSSNPKLNPKDVIGSLEKGPEPDRVTDGGLNSFSLEEERTGTGTVDYQAWVDAQLSEVPTDSEIEPLAKHCWPEWSKHWGGGWAAAWSTWTKDTAGRKKFRSDVVAQLAKVGLPKPMAPDLDNDRARARSAAWLDQRLAEAPKRMVDIKCAGCGKPRQLPPGQTHCHPCRKELVGVDTKQVGGVAAAVSIPLPAAT